MRIHATLMAEAPVQKGASHARSAHHDAAAHARHHQPRHPCHRRPCRGPDRWRSVCTGTTRHAHPAADQRTGHQWRAVPHPAGPVDAEGRLQWLSGRSDHRLPSRQQHLEETGQSRSRIAQHRGLPVLHGCQWQRISGERAYRRRQFLPGPEQFLLPSRHGHGWQQQWFRQRGLPEQQRHRPCPGLGRRHHAGQHHEAGTGNSLTGRKNL